MGYLKESSSHPNLQSAKTFLPGTKKTVNGKTYIVVGRYNDYGKILKSTQSWQILTKSNKKYLDTKRTVAKLHKKKSKSKSKKRSTKRKSKTSKKRSSKRKSKKRSKKLSTKRKSKKPSKKRSIKRKSSKKLSKRKSKSKSKKRSIPSNNTPSKNKRSPKALKHNRPSPAVSATEYSVGTVKKGNDGNKYVVIRTSNGNKRWVKNKSGGGIYEFMNSPAAKKFAHSVVDMGLEHAKSKGYDVHPDLSKAIHKGVDEYKH